MEGTVEVSARLERRLFEVLGGWVPSVPEPEVKLILRAHSFRHAWHAELWESLGTAAAVPAGAMDDVAALAPRVQVMARLEGTGARLEEAYGHVLPVLVRAYSAVLAAVLAQSAGTEGPSARALALMLADDEAAVQEVERKGLRRASGSSTMT